MSVVVLAIVIFLLVIVTCWALNFFRNRIIKQRLLNAVGRNVTTSHLTPLIVNKNVDKKIPTAGRSGCQWLDAQLPFIAIAAVEGNVSMMELLYENGADLTFTDARTGQNLLHLACTTGVTEAVRWCLHHPGAHRDHLASPRPGDNQLTPLMHVIKHMTSRSRGPICWQLIASGCDVNKMDSCYWTTLHYVTARGDPELVAMVIRAAPVHPILNSGNLRRGNPLTNDPHDESSPFVSLLTDHHDVANCLLLLEAGYKLHKDIAFVNGVLPRLDADSEFCAFLVETMQTPRSLLWTCRSVIRHAVGGVKLEEKLRSLNLPSVLLSYLQLQSHINNLHLTKTKINFLS